MPPAFKNPYVFRTIEACHQVPWTSCDTSTSDANALAETTPGSCEMLPTKTSSVSPNLRIIYELTTFVRTPIVYSFSCYLLVRTPIVHSLAWYQLVRTPSVYSFSCYLLVRTPIVHSLAWFQLVRNIVFPVTYSYGLRLYIVSILLRLERLIGTVLIYL